MTVSSGQSKVSYAGDGATVSFPVPFAFALNSDITVIKADAAGAETVWVESTHYTLSGAGDPGGGTLTVSTVPDDHTPGAGERLTIARVVPLTQETDYPEGGEFPARAHEDALDKLTHMAQQLAEQIGRAIKLPVSSGSADLNVPEPEASKILRWNAGADGLENVEASNLGATVLSDATPAPPTTSGGPGTSAEISRADHDHPLPAVGARLSRAGGQLDANLAADFDWTGAHDFGGRFGLSGAISPPQITANQNDYGPTGLAGASTLRLSANASRTITGLDAAGVADGDVKVIHNVGANDLVLAAENGGSSAANRFAFDDDVTIAGNQSAVLRYDGTSGRWRLATSSGSTISQASRAAVEAETDEDSYVPPDLLRHNRGVAKGWVAFDGSAGTLSVDASYNVAGLTDNGTGDYTVTWGTDFSSANYVVVGTGEELANNSLPNSSVTYSSRAAGSVGVSTCNGAGSIGDQYVHIAAFGDQ